MALMRLLACQHIVFAGTAGRSIGLLVTYFAASWHSILGIRKFPLLPILYRQFEIIEEEQEEENKRERKVRSQKSQETGEEKLTYIVFGAAVVFARPPSIPSVRLYLPSLWLPSDLNAGALR